MSMLLHWVETLFRPDAFCFKDLLFVQFRFPVVCLHELCAYRCPPQRALLLVSHIHPTISAKDISASFSSLSASPFMPRPIILILLCMSGKAAFISDLAFFIIVSAAFTAVFFHLTCLLMKRQQLTLITDVPSPSQMQPFLWAWSLH